MNGRRVEERLAVLIERSAELKRDLVDFACSPRLERSLAAAMLKVGLKVEKADAIGTIDRFALQYRLPDGKTVVDRFVASRPDLDAADREMLLGWRDPVEGMVFRNPEKVEQGWKQMREDRAAFVESFGCDELVLPPAEAEERLNAYYRHQQEAALARQPARRRTRNLPGLDVPSFEFPPGLADANTVGIIYDFTDGLNFYPEYGMLRDLFGNPALAADKRYADVLRGYLRSETIAPLPLQRLTAAYPDTVDAVFRKMLRRRDFTWAEHGEALMRRRKAWYYRREPRPGVTVIGDRLLELAFGGRG